MVLTKTTKTPCIEGYRVVTPVHSLCVLTDAGLYIHFMTTVSLGTCGFLLLKKEVNFYEYVF